MESKRALEEADGSKMSPNKKFAGKPERKLFKDSYVEDLIALYIDPENGEEKERLEHLFWSEFVDGVDIQDSHCNVNNAFCIFALKYLFDQDSPKTLPISRTIASYLMVLGRELFDDTDIVIENSSCKNNTKVIRFSGWTAGKRYSFEYLKECLLSNLFTSSISDWDFSAMVLRCLENGHFEFMLFLLKYCHFEFPVKYRYQLHGFSCMTNIILCCCKRILKENEVGHRVKFLDEEVFMKKLIKRGVFTLTRLSFVLYHIYFILRYKMLGGQRNMRVFDIQMKSLNIIREYTTEPDITIGEMGKFLRIFFNKCKTEIILKNLQNLHTQLSLYYPTYWNPRSLQDLTRCKIRSCFQKSAPIHSQISEIKIPRLLKNFLLIYDLKMDEPRKIFDCLVADTHML